MSNAAIEMMSELTLYRRDGNVGYNTPSTFIRHPEWFAEVKPEKLVKIAVMAGAEMANNNNNTPESK